MEADLTEMGGETAMMRLLDLPQRPTAVMAANDLQAMGALRVCQRLGIKVPEQISIAGFGDFPLSRLTLPSLTTVAQPSYELGCKAAELLLHRLEKPDRPPMHLILQSELVVRESTAGP